MNVNELSEAEKLSKISAMRTGYFEVENYRIEWKQEEIELLKRLFYDGVGISEIALTLRRSERGVIQRIELEHLFKKIRKPSGTHAVPTCKCSKCGLQTQCKNGGGQCTNKSEMKEIEHE